MDRSVPITMAESAPGVTGGHAITPAILLVMTCVTGIVDAVSYLALGHVFTANMTGNVVLLGFAVAGVKGLSATRSLTALFCFFAGAVFGGRVSAPQAPGRSSLRLRCCFSPVLPHLCLTRISRSTA